MQFWQLFQPDRRIVDRLSSECRLPQLHAAILVNRGVDSPEQARAFLNPHPGQMHDPFLMSDMGKAAERLLRQIRSGGRTMVFGDYDVDGTSGAAMLHLIIGELGGLSAVYIPDREREGYGLSSAGIDAAVHLGANLLITCDCGINAIDQVAYANAHGIDVIITDHHTPDLRLPDAFAVLNPKLPGSTYPFRGLCGGGVAFKLACAVTQLAGADPNLPFRHLDLVTLGTAADLVPLVDENRFLVKEGLAQLSRTEKPGLRALLEVSGVAGREPTVRDILFGLGPRINAAGRLGSAHRAVELFTTNDFSRAAMVAHELDAENGRRQRLQQTMVEEACRKVNAEVDLAAERAIVLWSEGWHAGVIGIVASRVKETFQRPAVIISVVNGVGKGSARSISGFDLYDNLSACSTHLEGFGGHPMAAGLTIRAEKLPEFRAAFVALANEALSDDDLVPSLRIDAEVQLGEIPELWVFLQKLPPHGPGNLRPQFVARGVTPNQAVLTRDRKHLRFTARQNGHAYAAIGFGMADKFDAVMIGSPVDAAFAVDENNYRGETSLQLRLRDLRSGST